MLDLLRDLAGLQFESVLLVLQFAALMSQAEFLFGHGTAAQADLVFFGLTLSNLLHQDGLLFIHLGNDAAAVLQVLLDLFSLAQDHLQAPFGFFTLQVALIAFLVEAHAGVLQVVDSFFVLGKLELFLIELLLAFTEADFVGDQLLIGPFEERS